MSHALFKLESFSRDDRETASTNLRAALDRSYQEGLAEGIAQRQAEDFLTLQAGLEQLRQSLTEDQLRREALRRDAIAALSPILSEIVDCLVPAAETLRFEQAFTDELKRLAHPAVPIRASITCNSNLRDMVDRCLTEAGIENVETIETDTGQVTLNLQGGRIEFSSRNVADEIRALIAELREESGTWKS